MNRTPWHSACTNWVHGAAVHEAVNLSPPPINSVKQKEVNSRERVSGGDPQVMALQRYSWQSHLLGNKHNTTKGKEEQIMDIGLGGKETNDLSLAPVQTNSPFHPRGHPNITKDMMGHQLNINKNLVGAG